MAAVIAASSLTPVMASAAENDTIAQGVYNNSTGEFLTLTQFQDLTTSAKIKWLKGTNVYIVIDGTAYKGTDVFTKTDAELLESGVDPKDVIKPGEPTELVVESVSAINGTVYKEEAEQVLAIQVNGNQSVTVEELEEAGYAVSFSANKAVFAGESASTTSTTGELISDLDTIKEFNYSVTVTKGEESFTSATTGKVTVVDASAIKSIDELELQKGGVAQKSTTVTLGDSGYQVVATKGTNIKGDEVKPVTGVTYKSSNNTVALVSANGTITPVSAGTTTITVTKGTASKTITLTVAEATRTITTVNADVTSVDIVEGSTKTVKVTAFDQFGDAYALTNEVTATPSKTDIATVGNVTYANGVATFVVTGEAKGSTTIAIKAGEKTISIPVTVGESKVASHSLELVTVADQSDDKTIDVAKSKDNKVTLAYNAYNDAGQLVGPATLTAYDKENPAAGLSYEVVEKSTSGVTETAGTIVSEVTGEQTGITLTAKKAGTVTVNIYDGALKVASTTVTVNDSTPTVTGATFIKDAKVTTTEATPVLKVSGLTFTSTASDAKFTEDGKITNAEGTVIYGAFDLVSNLEGATVAVTDTGELALKVTQTEGAAVSGTVSVRIKDNADKTVAVGAIDVNIAKVDPVEDVEEEEEGV